MAKRGVSAERHRGTGDWGRNKTIMTPQGIAILINANDDSGMMNDLVQEIAAMFHW
jgi:hypothetical protein